MENDATDIEVQKHEMTAGALELIIRYGGRRVGETAARAREQPR
jgi:hypothetical protein